jgi:hypothetical protein
VRQPYSYLVPIPNSLLKNSSTGLHFNQSAARNAEKKQQNKDYSFLTFLSAFYSFVVMSSLLYERGRRGQDPLVLGAAFVLPEEEIRRPGYFGLLAGRKVFATVLRHSYIYIFIDSHKCIQPRVFYSFLL